MTRRHPELFSIVLCAALAAASCRREKPAEEEPPRQVRCVPAESGNAEEVRTLRGALRPPPDLDAPVAARVAGTIVAIPVREGDAVKKGTVLALLDDRTLGDERRQAEHAVEQARAVSSAADAVAARKAKLFERGIVARADSEAAAAEAAKARADLGSAEAALDSARANFERTRITSPISGVVVRVFRQVGEIVDGNPGAPVVEVADPTRLELRAEAPVADLVRLENGQPVTLSVEGLEGPIEGKVTSVSPAVSAETGLGVVRISIPEKSRVPVGAMAVAQVTVKTHPSSVLVPAAALRGGAAGDLEVVVCRGDLARVAAVHAGIRTADGKVEITSGLKSGDEVVADGGLGIEDGAKIEKLAAPTDTGDAEKRDEKEATEK